MHLARLAILRCELAHRRRVQRQFLLDSTNAEGEDGAHCKVGVHVCPGYAHLEARRHRGYTWWRDDTDRCRARVVTVRHRVGCPEGLSTHETFVAIYRRHQLDELL